MAFKTPSATSTVPESPDRLFRDLPRRKHPSLYDHQGQMLRTYLAEAVDETDVALQLPTGSGKTLVGLLLAEWRRRKFNERVVFLCPTRQLVNQVVEEASGKYGLSVEGFTGSNQTYTPAAKAAYNDRERVAVTTYNSLFNTNPFFHDPDIIIVDDAHAAENYIGSQWTLSINRFDDEDKTLFSAVSAVLSQVLPSENYTRLTGNWESIDDATWVDKIPTGQFLQILPELRETIAANIGDTRQRWSWRMLSNNLAACQLYVSSSEIMLRPLIPPTWAHAPFANAKQRIFMSATLGAGGDLERLTGRQKIKRLPIPEGWEKQGIGRRFFLFPEKSLDEAATLSLRRSLMSIAGRSLVLSPSTEASEAVANDVTQHLKFPTFNAQALERTKTNFTLAPQAVAVVANRYDGIDFPDNDCRLLFVEGLPRAANLQERFLMNRMGAHLLFNERVQTRVLQAIGRCTRGLNDYSAVVITGEDLPEYLTDIKRRQYLHPELQAELSFGVEQSSKVDTNTFVENFKIFIQHEADWEAANAQILELRASATQEPFPAMDRLAAAAPFEIKYQAAMWQGDYALAFDRARDVLGQITDGALQGYRALWHYLAGSAARLAVEAGDVQLVDAARQQFASAKASAAGIPWLVALARGAGAAPPTAEEQESATAMLQIERLESYLAKLGTLHNRAFSAKEKEIRDGLLTAATFEQAQVKLGEHLGYAAGKREADASPDPWWMIGDVCIVFEDHADAKPIGATIDATKAKQAAGHPDWMKINVPGAQQAKVLPVLVTPAKHAKSGAMPTLHRVAYWDLARFREWSERALEAIRDLRRTFVEPGDLAWRAEAAAMLAKIGADAPGLYKVLAGRMASEHLLETA